MRKLSLFIICSIFVLFSCGKKAVTPITPLNYAISASIDGKEETFLTGDSVRNIGTTGVYITGLNDTTGDRIGIYAYNYNADFTPGTYTDTTKSGLSNSQILFYPAGDFTNYYYSYYIPGTYNYTSFVTVSALTNDNIQGFFSGDIVLVDYITGSAPLKHKVITNGKFDINFKR